MVALIVLGIIAALVLITLFSAVRIVHPYQRGVVEILGRYQTTAEPGLRVIIPFVQKLRIVDMREQVVDVPPQDVITEDNVVVSVDAVVYYEPTDPQRLMYNVANFITAVTKLAQTNLRNLIGDMDLDEALTSRDKINTSLRDILDDATDRWGVKVVRVEIQRIDPPHEVVASMHEQMKAERQRRALVTSAEGEREAAVTRAEGAQKAAVLEAEGSRQKQILYAAGQAEAARELAEAERFRLAQVAEGQAEAVRSVFKAIHDGDPTPDLLAVKYFESLQAIADGQATKVFLPADASGLMGTLAGLAEVVRNGDAGADGSVNGDRATPPPPPVSHS